MKTKLTLSIDKELVDFAHQQARLEMKTISSLFSDFLLARKTRQIKKNVASVDEMVGVLEGYTIDDSKQGIKDAYADKYLN